MDKFKKVLKSKWFIFLICVLVIGLTGAIMGLKLGKSSVKINPLKIQELIEADYTAEIVSENEDRVDLNIIGNLDEAQSLNLIHSLFQLGANWNVESVNVNFFYSKEDSKVVDKFYVDGLLKQVELNYITKTANIGTFQTVLGAYKPNDIVDYNKGEVEYKDNEVVIKTDMDLTDKDELDIVSQAKTFIVLFRDVNKDKEIESVQLDINHNGEKVAYSYNTDFENLLKTIQISKF